MTGRRESFEVAGWSVLAAAVVHGLLLLVARPLSWDEIEYARASAAVGRGLVPYRDFYEHHMPLQWLVFGPLAARLEGVGTGVVLALRWAQLPFWVAAFALLRLAALRCGAGRSASLVLLSALAASSAFVFSALEFRIDTLATTCFVVGLWLVLGGPGGRRIVSRRASFLAGLAFGFAGLANLRLAPLLAVAVLAGALYAPHPSPDSPPGSRSDPDGRDGRPRWRWNGALPWLLAGGVMAVVPVAGYLAFHGVLAEAWRCLVLDNAVGDAALASSSGRFLGRALSMFGVLPSPYTTGWFRWLDIDVAGLILAGLGGLGMVVGLSQLKRATPLSLVALLQLTNLLFVMRMKAIYDYHFQITLVLAVLLAGGLATVCSGSRVRKQAWGAGLVGLVLVAATAVANYAWRTPRAAFDYQRLVMTEVERLVSRDHAVFDGVGFALGHRGVRHDLWFLPSLVRALTRTGRIAPLTVAELERDPPGAVLYNSRIRFWMRDWPEVGEWLARHYAPHRQHLWLPTPNARLAAPAGSVDWRCAADGTYRLIASAALADHLWFGSPEELGSADGPEKMALEVRVEPELALEGVGGPSVSLSWWRNGQPLDGDQRSFELRRGDRISLRWQGLAQPLGVFLVARDTPVLFTMAPRGVDLDLPPRYARYPAETLTP